VYLLNEKNGIYSVQRDEVPEIRFFVVIIGWGVSGKAILNETIYSVKQFQFVDSMLFGQVRLAVFRRRRNIFRA